MRIIKNQGNWVPYELKPRDVERRFFACEQLFQRKGFLHRIMTGDEKWVHYDNPMPPRRRPDRIFTVPRLCSAFGANSSVSCIMSY